LGNVDRKPSGIGCGTIVVAGIVVVDGGITIVVAGIVVIEPGRVTVTAGRVVVTPGRVMVVAGSVIVEPGGVVAVPHPATISVSTTSGTIRDKGFRAFFLNIPHLSNAIYRLFSLVE
jgi:hypothetical protein